MKFATVLRHDKPAAGIIDPERQLFWPLAALSPALPADAITNLVSAIPHLAGVKLPSEREAWPLAEIRLTAPLPQPPHNILCVGKNYHAHAHEFAQSGFDSSAGTSQAVPDVPIIFTKPSSTISGPNADIPLTPGLDKAVDYEVELAVVIGKGGRAIPRDQAMTHVFGYTIINDVTARDLQQRHKQWFLGKSIDGFCPMGPWVVSKDECNLDQMRVACRVNGETRQDATVSDLIFDIPILIEVISRSMTLSPGDVIATGTPAGVGIGFDPPRFLAEGDVVECEITGIGQIRNIVRRVA